MPAHHCRKSFLLWLQSVGYKQKHGGFAYERSSRLRSNLTLEEAAAYSGIGINKLREMSDSKDCTFVLWNGTKRLLKRRRLDEHLDRLFSI